MIYPFSFLFFPFSFSSILSLDFILFYFILLFFFIYFFFFETENNNGVVTRNYYVVVHLISMRMEPA